MVSNAGSSTLTVVDQHAVGRTVGATVPGDLAAAVEPLLAQA